MRYTIHLLDSNPISKSWDKICDARVTHRHIRKFRVLFIYPQDELVNLAAQLAFVSGKTATDTDMSVSRAISQWFDVGNQENAPIIQDVLNLALSEVEDTLSCLSAGRIDDDRSYDVHLTPKKELVTEYIVSSDTRDSTLLHLQLAIKEYLLDCILTKWASLTRIDSAETWQAMAVAQLEKIREAGRKCLVVTTIPKYPPW